MTPMRARAASRTVQVRSPRAKREYPYHYLKFIGSLVGAGQTIVEIGGMRQSLNHPADRYNLPCCEDGHSTRILCESLATIYSVDVNPAVAVITAAACKGFDNCFPITYDGVQFLKEFTKEIHVLFLDAWDVVAGSPYAEKHAEAYEAARPKLAKEHIVAIDDTDVPDGGKGKILIPKLLQLGYIVLRQGRQTILKAA